MKNVYGSQKQIHSTVQIHDNKANYIIYKNTFIYLSGL